MKKIALVLVGMTVTVNLFADTYYWLPAPGTVADATDLDNWSIQFDPVAGQPVATAHPTRLPTASDDLCAMRELALNLNGASLAFKNLTALGTSPYTGETYWGAEGDTWFFENGTLTVGKCETRNRTGDYMTLTNGMHLVITNSFTPGSGMGSDGVPDINIASGCSISNSITYFANGCINVAAGGEYTTDLIQNSGYQPTPRFYNNGTTRIGSVVYSSADSRYALEIHQQAGTMILGGAFDRKGAGSLSFSVSGGTLRSSGAVSFPDVTSASFAAGSSMTLQVDAGCSLDLTPFTYGDNVTFTLTGPGDLILGNNLPSALAVAAGGVFSPAGTRCNAFDITVASGGAIRFKSPGAACRMITFAQGASATMDMNAFASGDVVLVSESDATLTAAATLLNAWFTTTQQLEFEVEKKAGTLVLSRQVDGTFDATSGLGLDDPNGWSGQTVPAAGSDVAIVGTGTVELSNEDRVFNFIALKEGATLRLTGGTEAAPFVMPPLEVDCYSGLTIVSNAYVCYTNNTLACRATATALPVFEIERGATLFAAGIETFDGVAYHSDIVFKNMDLHVYGTIVTPLGAVVDYGGLNRIVTLRLGMADDGETAYFGFVGDQGAIRLRNGCWTYDHGYLRICCPGAGGRVETPNPLVFKDFNFPVESGRSINALLIGINNTAASGRMRIEAENTLFDVSDTSRIGGNVDIIFTRGGSFVRVANYFLYSVGLTFADSATVSFGAGSVCTFGRCGASRPGLTFDSTGTDLPAITLNGATLQPWITAGNRTGSLKVSGTNKWSVGNFACDGIGSKTNQFTIAPSPLFTGFKEVCLDEGGVLEVIGEYVHYGMNPAHYKKDWGRAVTVAKDIPMTGAGALRVRNLTTDDSMAVTVLCSSNSATGTAGAAAGENATLLFNDGANWAGTVIANGALALTNIVDGAAPATVAFGEVQLDSDFPVRVWKDGVSTTNDVVNVAGAFAGDGRLVGVPMADYVPQNGDAFTIGAYPASAVLPKGRSKWDVDATPIAGTDMVLLELKYGVKGTLLIFK